MKEIANTPTLAEAIKHIRDCKIDSWWLTPLLAAVEAHERDAEELAALRRFYELTCNPVPAPGHSCGPEADCDNECAAFGYQQLQLRELLKLRTLRTRRPAGR